MSVKTTVLYKNYPIINLYLESGNTVEVYYKNAFILSLSAGDTIKLNTKNKVLKGTILVGSNCLNTKNTILKDYLEISVENGGAIIIAGDKPTNLNLIELHTGSTITNGYTCPNHVIMTGNDRGTNSGIYTATYTPANGYCWSDMTTESVTVTLGIHYRVGGRVFYVNSSSTGNTYTFYTLAGAVISDQTVSGLANAYYYDKSGSNADKFYVFDTAGTNGSNIYWGYASTSISLSDTIGSGKTNTTTVLNKGVPTDKTPNIWEFIKNKRDTSYNDCNDWFVGSQEELKQLTSSGLASSWLVASTKIWSSYGVYSTGAQAYNVNTKEWGNTNRTINSPMRVGALRAF